MIMGQKIRERREHLGLSQQELAEKVGMLRGRISEIENGTHTGLSLTHLRSMARTLGVSADYLIGTWEETPPSPPPPRRPRGRPRKRPLAETAAGVQP